MRRCRIIFQAVQADLLRLLRGCVMFLPFIKGDVA